METDFAVFILTHGRPDNVKTYGLLRKDGYTGPIYLIVDNEDPTIDDYRSRYENVVVFDKAAVAAKTQCADSLPGHSGVVIFARNACFDIARSLGITYFMQLDDDYTRFRRRFDRDDVFFVFENDVTDLDAVFDSLLRFYKSTPFLSVAMLQGGDYIGGSAGDKSRSLRLMRKAMNSFLCSTERPFQFIGRVNEDVNTFLSLGSQGMLFGSTNQIFLDQTSTQQSSGGMTEHYRKYGTYAKSFYPVLYCPSSVRVEMMRSDNPRIHHGVDWNATVPKILPASLRKSPSLATTSHVHGR